VMLKFVNGEYDVLVATTHHHQPRAHVRPERPAPDARQGGTEQ
jgi:hypothetical protein